MTSPTEAFTGCEGCTENEINTHLTRYNGSLTKEDTQHIQYCTWSSLY